MTDKEQKKAAKEFAEYWKDKGDEKGESQPFWLSLLRDVFGIEHPEKYITFEDRVFLGHTSFIDGYIENTHVLIEQKKSGKSLTTAIKQSDGSMLTPYNQAQRYSASLPYSKRPRWIVTCNFQEFLIYDMEKQKGDPEKILLENLESEYYRLQFLVNTENYHLKKELEVSIQAGEIVGLLYDAFLKEYRDPENEDTLKSLNILCVRLVFCLYAEDAGIFGTHGMFHDYLAEYDAKHMRKALIELFKVLDTKVENRDAYLEPELAAFPYVNGGLFENENIEIPNFNDDIVNLLLEKASSDFDWSEISPTIFGAVFESTLNPETRRSGGMHYTSIENIHKVIDPLFLDDLKQELNDICIETVWKNKKKKLEKFQEKLASLYWLDPAAGSGNFLTETYISIRKLENKVIKELQRDQMIMIFSNPIKVSIHQFYGIEINDFAVTVAKTALWIAESQMMKLTEDIVNMNLEFLPLKGYVNIVEGNALILDWNDVIKKEKLNFIMGNPPFIGARLMNNSQKKDLQTVFEKGTKGINNVDYVSGWYIKAANYIQMTTIKVAFVSTNSIAQGEQASIVWNPIFKKGIVINFAYQTFKWNSEAKDKAQVHCIIVGFSNLKSDNTVLYIDEIRKKRVNNINAYLVDAPNVFINNRRKPICNVPEMVFGSMPNDGGNLSNYSVEDVKIITSKYPNSSVAFRQFLGATEFLNGKQRYCIWLKDIDPITIKKFHLLSMQ